MKNKQTLHAIYFSLCLSHSVIAFDPPESFDSSDASEDEEPVEKMTIHARSEPQIGENISASQGSISRGEIEQRPVLRSGEILEFVPGMVTTQHSGSGKANQYFLRGFNLDHGTDFRSEIDGMPINMRTHGHGQGYTDLNFIVPEFIQRIDYQKGPYHAENGDFSTAGSANFHQADTFAHSLIQFEVGEDHYYRSVFAHEITIAQSRLLLGLENHRYEGPWSDIDEDVNKNNVFIKFVNDSHDKVFSVTFMGYQNEWNAADQIPHRAVTNQLIDELGSLDMDVGGESSRYSLSANFDNDDWDATAYFIDSDLELFSNFTYFLDDPVNGDEFEQVDDRQLMGGELVRKFTTPLQSNHIHHTLGIEYRFDDIKKVGLYKTSERQRISQVREDTVEEQSLAVFWKGEMDLTQNLTSNIGIRYDYLDVEVTSDDTRNSGEADDGLLSIKGGLRYQFSNQFYGYLNAGQSFHSNDARGATITIDPISNTLAEPVDLMVRGEGAEVGLHYQEVDQYNLSMSVWYLELDSELLFVGDAGNTEAGRASRRQGIELAGYFWMGESFSTDVELAWSHARFRETQEGEGDHIEGALPFVSSVGINWLPYEHWRTSVRLRYFGERPLDSFSDQESDDFSVVNFALTYQLARWKLDFKVLNVLDSDDHDIDYFYASRLQGEPIEGIEDNHFHPIEPRTLRLQAGYWF
ncbi:MAG: TonB-dependent receptor [Pseudomonadota bacterium]